MSKKFSLQALSEASIKRLVSEEIYSRGHGYYQNGAVSKIQCIGKNIEAYVEGSEYEPYRINIEFDSGGIKGTPTCSCPYSSNYYGSCKHIAASLIAVLNNPEDVIVRENVLELVSGLSKDKLIVLLEEVVSSDGDLLDKVENFIEGLSASKKVKKKGHRKSQVDPIKYKDQVIAIVHSLDRMSSSQAYWHVSSVVGEVQDLISKADPFLENGDSESAIQILKGVAQGYSQEWTILDGSDGETPNPFYDLDERLAYAVLISPLSQSVRDDLLSNIDEWDSELSDYGVDDAFATVRLAIDEGWTDEVVLDSLAGKKAKSNSRISNDEEDSSYGYYHSRDSRQIINTIRLNILEKQERYDEYMNFALSMGMITDFLCMKIEKGELKEAVSLAKKKINSGKEAYEVVKQLREVDALKEALKIGEIGLSFSDCNDTLGDYLSDLAENMGKKSLAFKAINDAFVSTPTLERYNRAIELIPKSKVAETKNNYLKRLREMKNYYDPFEKVKIFLQEKLLDDAIKEAQSFGYYREELLIEVMDKVIDYKPDWVIKESKKRAMSIIDEGKAKYYSSAVNWLKWTKKGYQQKNKENFWEKCLNNIRDNHRQKRKLMGLLQDIF